MDEAWKTRQRGCAVPGSACGPRRQPSGWNIALFKSRGRALPMCGGSADRSGGTSPRIAEARRPPAAQSGRNIALIQNRGRVAFPTLRPPRLRLFGGPAPWTKRGKRTTAVALVEVGSTPDRVPGETVRCQATSKTDPGRHEIRPPVDRRHGVDGVIHALSTATIPSQSSRGGQGVGNPRDDLGRCPFRTSPLQTGAGLRFPPFAHRAFRLLGTGAVDKAWITPSAPCH